MRMLGLNGVEAHTVRILYWGYTLCTGVTLESHWGHTLCPFCTGVTHCALELQHTVALCRQLGLGLLLLCLAEESYIYLNKNSNSTQVGFFLLRIDLLRACFSGTSCCWLLFRGEGRVCREKETLLRLITYPLCL